MCGYIDISTEAGKWLRNVNDTQYGKQSFPHGVDSQNTVDKLETSSLDKIIVILCLGNYSAIRVLSAHINMLTYCIHNEIKRV